MKCALTIFSLVFLTLLTLAQSSLAHADTVCGAAYSRALLEMRPQLTEAEAVLKVDDQRTVRAAKIGCAVVGTLFTGYLLHQTRRYGGPFKGEDAWPILGGGVASCAAGALAGGAFRGYALPKAVKMQIDAAYTTENNHADLHAVWTLLKSADELVRGPAVDGKQRNALTHAVNGFAAHASNENKMTFYQSAWFRCDAEELARRVLELDASRWFCSDKLRSVDDILNAIGPQIVTAGGQMICAQRN